MSTIASSPLLLPVIFSDVDKGTTLQSGTIAVSPFHDFSCLVRALSQMAGTTEDITVFVERSTRERVRMVAKSDLIRLRAVCLHVIIGLPQDMATKRCTTELVHNLCTREDEAAWSNLPHPILTSCSCGGRRA